MEKVQSCIEYCDKKYTTEHSKKLCKEYCLRLKEKTENKEKIEKEIKKIYDHPTGLPPSSY